MIPYIDGIDLRKISYRIHRFQFDSDAVQFDMSFKPTSSLIRPFSIASVIIVYLFLQKMVKMSMPYLMNRIPSK